LRGSMKLQRAAAAALVSLVAIGTGCETKGFLDPTEIGRFEKTPLVVPILDKLVVGIETDDVQFAGAREVTADDLEVASSDYRIGANDLLQVTIQDLAGAGTQSVETKRVSESGKVSLPYLNQVSVVGLTEAEAEEAVVAAYADAQILPKAIVGVAVVESQNRIYSISGAISQPGAYPLLRGDLRLMEAIANARGVTSELGIDHVYILRRKQNAAPQTPDVQPGVPGVDPLAPSSRANGNAPVFAMQATPTTPEEANAAAERLAREIEAARAGNTDMSDRVIQIEDAGTQPAAQDPGMTTIPPIDNDPLAPNPTATVPAQEEAFEFTAPAEPTDQEVIKVPYDLLKRGELKYNVVLRPGDMIIIPSPPIGEYYMAPHSARPGVYSLSARNITLSQAVISAGGLDGLAIPARTDIVRRLGRNQQVFVRVDLERIFAGLEPDVYLKPDDQVRVGTNMGAPFALALRNAFRITYGFGFLYDRNYAPSNTNN
jgi:polysaccharide biosynthesis/export protein